MRIEEIIKNEIEPRVPDECKRLGIPREFIIGIDSYKGYLFEDGFCECVTKNGKIVGVELQISREEKRPRGARATFFYLMKRAEQYYKGKPTSAVKAYIYEIKRGLEVDAKTILRKISFGKYGT
jgi:hypothetical protein